MPRSLIGFSADEKKKGEVIVVQAVARQARWGDVCRTREGAVVR